MVSEPVNPAGRNRGAITVAGTLASAASIAAIASANRSTRDPAGLRTYLGGAGSANSRCAVVRDIDRLAAIAALLSPSTWCSRCTSAQSCTSYIP